VISQQLLSGKALDQAVLNAFHHQAHALYDFYRHWNTPPEKQSLVTFDPLVQQIIEQSQSNDPSRGFVVVGIHLSNFDFALRLVFRKGLRALVITLSELPGGYQQQFDMRRSVGMEIVPASMAAFRQAISRLESGGLVLTGLDSPIPNPKYHPRFFGHAAALPVHYVQIALKARVPVLLAALELQKNGAYQFLFSEPIEMLPFADHHTEIIYNAEQVLKVAEGFLRRAPQQWAMFKPVWPGLMNRVP
jgi:lauroyl/myristoyl acyltransferase